MTKSNVIGYVASFPIPEVIRGINSFTLAAQKVNPNIKTKIVWAFTWYDPGKEAEAAASASLPGSYHVKAQTIFVLIFGFTF